MAHNEAVLKNGERLFAGQFLKSNNGLFYALMQEDGNLVIYRGDLFKTKSPGYEKTAVWSVWPAGQAPGGGTGYHLYMQTDGNLCIYRQEPHAVPWCAAEAAAYRRNDGRVLEMLDSGRLDINRVWTSNSDEGFDQPELERIEYILDPPPKIISSGPPRVSLSQVAHNPDQIERQTADLEMTYTKTRSATWKNTTSLKVSASSKTTLEVPFIGSGEISITTEISNSFEFGKTETESETVKISLKVNVPPGKSVLGKCIWRESKFNVPYRAILKVKFHGYPEKLPASIEGVYEGIGSHDVETWWKDVTGVTTSAATAAASVGDGWNRGSLLEP